MHIDKMIVARNFSEAATDYDSGAEAQARIAAGLAERIFAHSKIPPSRIIDLGCGSGKMCELLIGKFPRSSIQGIDIAWGMIEQCRKRWQGEQPRMEFQVGDAEDPKLISSTVDLVCAASSSQWFSDPECTFFRWASALPENGILATASLVTGSCLELAEAYSKATGSPWKGLRFLDPDTMPQIAKATGLRPCCCETETTQVFYKDAMAALRSFSTIGAQFKNQPSYVPLSSAAMRRVLREYTIMANSQGQVPVSYCVQYFIAQKKGDFVCGKALRFPGANTWQDLSR